MKKIPELHIEPAYLFTLQFGSIKAQLLMSAIELKIFDTTTQPVTSNEVATAAGTHPENTELFLNALTAINLLKKKDGKFQNTEISAAFLTSSSKTSLSAYLQMNEQFMFHNREQLKEAVINGPPAKQEQNRMDGDFFAEYTKLMGRASLTGISQSVANALSNLPEFKDINKMLDLGGAHGVDCMAILQKHPLMTGVVYDLPPVIVAAKEIISDFGMEQRVSFMEGDYTVDSIGCGYDLVYAKGTLNFAGPALGQVVKKIYDALNNGGLFISIHDGLTEEKTKPQGIVISWLQHSLIAKDLSFAEEIIPDTMKSAGFTNIETFPFTFPMGERLEMGSWPQETAVTWR